MRILGIDPGSRITGYGIIDVQGARIAYVTSGVVRVSGEEWPGRLRMIFDGVRAIVELHQPQQLAIEKVFMHRNPESALKLGQARGAALCAGLLAELPVAEYSATQVKQATVGKGHADKEQIQHMVRLLLKIPGGLTADSADALAIALCHAHHFQTTRNVARADLNAYAHRTRSGRGRARPRVVQR